MDKQPSPQETQELLDVRMATAVDALLINKFLTFADYPGFGTFKDAIYSAIYKNVPGSTGSNESGETNAHLALKDKVVQLSTGDKMKVYTIYQAVVGGFLKGEDGGAMIVAVLFPDKSNYLV